MVYDVDFVKNNLLVDFSESIIGKNSGGTSDYRNLSNKPSINGHELNGNLTSQDLDISSETDKTLSVTDMAADSKVVGTHIGVIEQLCGLNDFSDEAIRIIMENGLRKEFFKVYGFHIDSSVSDPYEAVTYLEDAIGMQPAHMNYESDTFDYGSWEDAFFMPKPCMLNADGTVDYYLDPNDYNKKIDGTWSDIIGGPGNAMMEWGKNGKRIWYKVVPDEDDNTSVSVYFCGYKLDDSYHVWSFINSEGKLVDHFYTSIYNGTIDSNGALRSLSGLLIEDLCQNKTVDEEINAAELNNPGTDELWFTETFSDVILIDLLLVLMGKSLDTQAVFGNGRTGQVASSAGLLSTGSMNTKGLFWGNNGNNFGVKVFGMENYWGNQERRIAGLVTTVEQKTIDSEVVNVSAVKYKLTKSSADGTSVDDYNTIGYGYLDSGVYFNGYKSGYVDKFLYMNNGAMFFTSFNGSEGTYYSDDCYVLNSGTNYGVHGGACMRRGQCGAFRFGLYSSNDQTWSIGASLSCKPKAVSQDIGDRTAILG